MLRRSDYILRQITLATSSSGKCRERKSQHQKLCYGYLHTQVLSNRTRVPHHPSNFRSSWSFSTFSRLVFPFSVLGGSPLTCPLALFFEVEPSPFLDVRLAYTVI